MLVFLGSQNIAEQNSALLALEEEQCFTLLQQEFEKEDERM